MYETASVTSSQMPADRTLHLRCDQPAAGPLIATWRSRVEVPTFRDLEEFGPTIGAAAEQLSISPTAVEKDYWVTQVLRALRRRFDDDFVFKGGTSLSKGYSILERFSDDIDILILPRDRGKGATDKLMKTMGEVSAASVGEAARYGGTETGVHRAYRVSYPATYQPTEAIATSVLLEMGVRGGPNPNERVQIGSLLGDALEAAGTDLTAYDDLSPFSLAVLHPGRTLLEKLYVIHGLAKQVMTNTINGDKLRRDGRHFYDVYKLLGDTRVLALLADRVQVKQIMASIEMISQGAFREAGELRPPDGFAASPAFDPASDVSQQMRRAYGAIMPALYFGDDPLPEWDDICGRVHSHSAML